MIAPWALSLPVVGKTKGFRQKGCLMSYPYLECYSCVMCSNKRFSYDVHGSVLSGLGSSWDVI